MKDYFLMLICDSFLSYIISTMRIFSQTSPKEPKGQDVALMIWWQINLSCVSKPLLDKNIYPGNVTTWKIKLIQYQFSIKTRR